MKKMFLVVTLMMKGEWLMRNAGVLMLALMLSLAVPATGKVVFNICIKPDTYGNAYQGGPAAYDDGINTWYLEPVFTGTGWTNPYNYNYRVLPSGGQPAGTNAGLRIEFGWTGVAPDSFIDPNFNGLMSAGAMVNHLYPTSFSTLQFFGEAASIGIYDVYVYSNAKTQFKWTYETTWQTLNGYQGVWDDNHPTFVLGQNYLIYPSVNLDNAAHGNTWVGIQFRSPDDTHIGALSALQLVYKGIPISPNDVNGLPNGTFVNPTWITWAHDFDSWHGPITTGGLISWCQKGEWLQYDIFADGDANQGFYDVYVRLESPYTDANCGVSLDGGPVHTVSAYSASVNWNGATVDQHAGRWYISKRGNSLRLDVLSKSAFNIWGIQFVKSADQTKHCADVQEQGQTLKMDFNGDCIVNLDDLAVFTDNWLNCNDPEKCP